MRFIVFAPVLLITLSACGQEAPEPANPENAAASDMMEAGVATMNEAMNVTEAWMENAADALEAASEPEGKINLNKM